MEQGRKLEKFGGEGDFCGVKINTRKPQIKNCCLHIIKKKLRFLDSTDLRFIELYYIIYILQVRTNVKTLPFLYKEKTIVSILMTQFSLEFIFINTHLYAASVYLVDNW